MVIGHHPCLLLAGTAILPAWVVSWRWRGLLQQPLEMVPAETVDLEVQARAEIVIEGVLDTSPENLREEGPFGEYPRYYTGVGPRLSKSPRSPCGAIRSMLTSLTPAASTRPSAGWREWVFYSIVPATYVRM